MRVDTAVQEASQGAPTGQTLDRASRERRILRRVAVLVVSAVFFLSVLRVAWYGDDWLITLRTALNAVHGNGMSYNVDERVAGFTHPLWLLVIIATGTLTTSWVYSVMLLSALLATGAVALLLSRVRTVPAFLFVAACLVFSNTSLVWSTGGLEGALAAMLICGWVAAAPSLGDSWGRYAAWGVLAGLVGLTRLDLLLLIAPLFAFVLLGARSSWRSVGWTMAGLLAPLLAWFGFSTVYYGSPLPTTLLAKTNVDIPVAELVGQGLFYLDYSLRADPLVCLPLIGAVVAVILTRRATAVALLAGVVAYLGYVVWVGGDFMAGRFLYLPAFVALLVIAESSRGAITSRRTWQWLFAGGSLLTVVAAFGTSLVFQADTGERSTLERGVIDERSFWLFAAHTNVFPGFPQIPTPAAVPGMDASSLERTARAWQHVPHTVPRPTQVHVAGVGFQGMNAGPATHIIDLSALTDRFLAQQTFVPQPGPVNPVDQGLYSGPGWRIGHFARPLPQGYLEAVMYDDPSRVTDPQLQQELRALWERIR